MKENIEVMKQQMSTTYLNVIAELGKTALTVREIMELKEGDVIKLKKRVNHEIEVIVAGKRKLAARPGSVDGKKAVRITRQLTDDDLVEEDITFKEKDNR
jgi:flagellar motor switch protein FliM